MKLPFWKGNSGKSWREKLSNGRLGPGWTRRKTPTPTLAQELSRREYLTPVDAHLITNAHLSSLNKVFLTLLLSWPLDLLLFSYHESFHWLPELEALEWSLLAAGAALMGLSLAQRPIVSLLELLHRARRSSAQYQQLWSLLFTLGIAGWIVVDMTLKAAQTSLLVAGLIALGAMLLAPIWYRSIRNRIIERNEEDPFAEFTPAMIIQLHQQIVLLTIALMFSARAGHFLTLLACILMEAGALTYALVFLTGLTALLMLAPDRFLFRTRCRRCTRDMMRGSHPGEYCGWCAQGLREDSSTEFVRRASHGKQGWTLMDRIDQHLRDPFKTQGQKPHK